MSDELTTVHCCFNCKFADQESLWSDYDIWCIKSKRVAQIDQICKKWEEPGEDLDVILARGDPGQYQDGPEPTPNDLARMYEDSQRGE